MKQKWISILVCALILMLSFSFPASAVSDGFESIQDAEEYSEILALQDDILTQINNIVPLERPNQTIVFTEEDKERSSAE